MDTFWHPWRQGGHPGRSLGVPLGILCITFASIFAVSAPWLLLWLPGVPSRSPPGVEMWLKHSKYRCFAKVRIWSPRCQKGAPGVPRDVFWALFWHLLEHLGVPFAPVATLRPHVKTAVDESVYLCVFAIFWLHPAPQLTCKPGQQWNGKHSGKTLCAVIARERAAFFFVVCLLCFYPFFKPRLRFKAGG